MLDDESVFAEVQRPPSVQPRQPAYDWVFGPPHEHLRAIHTPAGAAPQWLGDISVRYDTHHEAPAFVRCAADTQTDEQPCPYDLPQTVRALLASLHPKTKRLPVSPAYVDPATLPAVGYPVMLMQILANLVLNSARHAFECVSQPLIESHVRARQGKVEQVYSDNGVAVPASLHARIFEPLFTTRRASSGTAWA